MLSGRLIHVSVGSSGAGGGGADVTSARNRVVEARGTLAEAQARERELPADAKESERISARNNVVSATNDLTEAEQDLATATTDAADTTAQAAEHMVKIDPQIEQLGKLPGLLVNGLFESLGIGDIFPDFTQTSAWKSFAGGLSAFKGPIQGLVEGKLGIQQPGWRPGMPVPEPAGSGEPAAQGGGGFTIPGVGGLPDIALPPPPQGLQGPGGPPGPTNVTNISADINYHDSVIGEDPDAARQRDKIRQDNAIARNLPWDPGQQEAVTAVTASVGAALTSFRSP